MHKWCERQIQGKWVALRFLNFHGQYMMVQGYKDGEPISRKFFDEHISGGHNILLSKFLWPDRDQESRDRFSDEKESLFRKYAGVQTHSIQPCLHV